VLSVVPEVSTPSLATPLLDASSTEASACVDDDAAITVANIAIPTMAISVASFLFMIFQFASGIN
jgi:hypothetical protein